MTTASWAGRPGRHSPQAWLGLLGNGVAWFCKAFSCVFVHLLASSRLAIPCRVLHWSIDKHTTSKQTSSGCWRNGLMIGPSCAAAGPARGLVAQKSSRGAQSRLRVRVRGRDRGRSPGPSRGESQAHLLRIMNKSGKSGLLALATAPTTTRFTFEQLRRTTEAQSRDRRSTALACAAPAGCVSTGAISWKRLMSKGSTIAGAAEASANGSNGTSAESVRPIARPTAAPATTPSPAGEPLRGDALADIPARIPPTVPSPRSGIAACAPILLAEPARRILGGVAWRRDDGVGAERSPVSLSNSRAQISSSDCVPRLDVGAGSPEAAEAAALWGGNM